MSKIADKVCFVVGPIGEPDSEMRIHADWFLEEILEPTFKDYADFRLERADKLPQPGMIDTQIIKKLRDSELVIADLSMPNANVFYEIGIRHMFRKPIIHMQLATDAIPFDVSLYRAIKFSRRRPLDLRTARSELKDALNAVLDVNYELDNPITRAIGQIQVREQATPEQKVLLDQIASIERRISVIETSARPAKKVPAVEADSSDLELPEFSVSVFFDANVVDANKIKAAVRKAMLPYEITSAKRSSGKIRIDYAGIGLENEFVEQIKDELATLSGITGVKFS